MSTKPIARPSDVSVPCSGIGCAATTESAAAFLSRGRNIGSGASSRALWRGLRFFAFWAFGVLIVGSESGFAQVEASDFDAAAQSASEWEETDETAEGASWGLFASRFQRPFLVRGQESDYWGTVQQQYTPTFVAQTTDAASVQPSLGAPSSGTQVAGSTSTTSIAPPLTDVNTSILAPCPAPPAPEGDTFLTEPVGTMKRFWDSFSLNYTYIPRSSQTKGLGINEFDLAGRFAFPCKLLPHANDNAVSGYWFIAPSFGLTLWDGPTGYPEHAMSMPSKTFEAAMAFGARPQFTKDFGVELWVQVGVASSFKKLSSDAIFIRGRALGTLRINEQIEAVGGVVYYDRNRYKLLPSGGITWKPNDGNLWYLVFPNPKLSRFLRKVNETDWWGYVQGDIGGGRWLVHEEQGKVNVDYNDYRVGVGVTFSTPSSIAGSLEVGGAFGRELYSWGTAWYEPKSMVYLKGGIMY